jgi:hypothetical protein
MEDNERINDAYNPQEEWKKVNVFLQRNVRNGGDVMDQNLALLVCFLRGEDLIVVNQHGASNPLGGFPGAPIRYLYHHGGHWQELRPYNQQ